MRIEKDYQLQNAMQNERNHEKARQDDYKQFLDQQMKYNTIKAHHTILPQTKDSRKTGMGLMPGDIPQNNAKEHMIPGINNLNTVGSSPLKRMAHQMVTLQRRDGRYNQEGAGQVTSKINCREQLPSMLKANTVNYLEDMNRAYAPTQSGPPPGYENYSPSGVDKKFGFDKALDVNRVEGRMARNGSEYGGHMRSMTDGQSRRMAASPTANENYKFENALNGAQ